MSEDDEQKNVIEIENVMGGVEDSTEFYAILAGGIGFMIFYWLAQFGVI